MRCPRCQHENAADAAFCDECGARLETVCSGCGESNRSGANFCRKCGHGLSAVVPSTPSRFDTPQAYTPKHLAEKILTSKAALEGERKQVTVLFADLKGSMELLADRDPEEARNLLDPVLERMMEAVHRYEGTVNQVMGDGIMALFGAPLAHEDHAVRACYAALRMQDSVKSYAEEVRRDEGILPQIRVGVNSGEVVVRSIGSDLRMDYTAVGQTTHLAARMEQMAAPGSILLAADTLRLAEGYVQVNPLGLVRVKGLIEPVEIYELTGAEPVRTRFQAAAARGLTAFVGRQAELATLHQVLERARAGQGQVAAVVGEPGVGKSRLFWELTHSPRTEGWLVVESGSVSYGKATAYLPIIDLLKVYFQIDPQDDTRKTREKVSGKLVTLEQSLMEALPVFAALLDLPIGDAHWRALDPAQRRQRTFDALRGVFIRESHVQPLCLVLEDLHWIDSETQAFLDELVDSLPAARILLLVNYRPEYGHGWSSKTYYTQLRVDPLQTENAEALLSSLIGTAADLRPLRQLLIARTEGNPFFLEESVRALVEMQCLVGDRGAYRLAKPVLSAQVPATVQAILAARIDRLRPELKHLLQSAAVVGKDVPFSVLEAIADLPDDDLRRGLSHLQAAEFLYETRLFPDLEYTFKHALTHEVAYGSLLQERRRVLHARIVDAFERLYPARVTEQIERLGQHALRGELWARAATYLPQAGMKAAERGAYKEAAVALENALVALAQLPEDRARIEQAIDLRIELRVTVLVFLDFQRALSYLRDAEGLAKALGDQQRLARIAAHKTHSLWLVGEYEQAIAAGQEALALAQAIGDFSIQVAATQYLGQVFRTIGVYPQAMALFRKTIALLEGESQQGRFGMHALPAVLARVFLTDCLATLGEFDEALTRAHEAIEIADIAGHPFSIVAALAAFGFIVIRKGDPDQLLSYVERGATLCRAWSVHVWSTVFDAAVGLAYALAGRTEEALTILEEGKRQAIARQANPTPILPDLGRAFLLAGRLDEAGALASLALARSRDGSGNRALTMHILGETTSNRAPDEAERNYREALEQAGALGMRPLIADCHFGLGKLYRRTGKREQAREHLTTATTMYREMDMRFWLEQAEAELRELG